MEFKTTIITATLALSFFAAVPANADNFSKFSNSFARNDGAIETLKNGQAAQNKRNGIKLNSLDRKTRNNLAGKGKDMDVVRHKGDQARLKRNKVKLQEVANGKTTKTTKTAKVTKTASSSKVVASGAKPVRKNGLKVTFKTPASSAATPARTATKTAARTAPKASVKTASALGKTAKTAKTAKKTAKFAKSAKTVGKLGAGMGGALVAEAALGVDVPDVFDAAEFTYAVFKDPKNADKKIFGLANGATEMTVTALDAITDPGQMARNLGNSAKGLGKAIAGTGVYKSVAKTKTGKAVGAAATAGYKATAKAYNNLKETKTGKAIGKVTGTVDKVVFKSANKVVNKAAPVVTKAVSKATNTASKATRKTVKTVSKGAKKVGKSIKKIFRF